MLIYIYMAFLRGHWNAESGLVLNEHSLKLLMLELCARGEKRTCGKREEAPRRRCRAWIYVCCVLTASLERINTPGIRRRVVSPPPHQAALPTQRDGHTIIAQCSTKCCEKRPHLRLGPIYSFIYLFIEIIISGRSRAHSRVLCV